MKKYVILISIFLTIWSFLFFKYGLEPRLMVHEKKSQATTAIINFYKFDDTEILNAPDEIVEKTALEITYEFSTEEVQFKKTVESLILKRWSHFIQYNANDFCILKTDKDENTIHFINCNSDLFKRSLSLALNDYDFTKILSTIEYDFLYQINSITFKEKLNEKDSFYTNINNL